MKCGVYVRVSSEDQVENTSLDDQERMCRQYAARKGWSVVDLYREEGFTGTSNSRPRWDRLMVDARAGLLDVVIVYNWKRFARNARVGLNISFELEELGVALAVTEMELDTTTSQGRFMRTQMLALAEMDRDNVVEQLARGQYAKARRGQWPSSASALPYGYTLEGEGRTNRVVINEPEAEQVRLVVGWIVDDGASTGTAAAWLTAMGHRQRSGTPWSHQNLRRVLTSKSLTGELWWGRPRPEKRYQSPHQLKRFERGGYLGEPVCIRVDPVVTAQRWQALQSALDKTAYGSQGPRGVYPLAHRSVSPCGGAYGGMQQKGRNRIYRCKHHRWHASGRPACDCPNLMADDLESRVWQAVTDLLGDPARLVTMASDYLAERTQAEATERDELEQVEEAIAKLERRLGTEVIEYIRAGVSPAAVKAASDAIESDLTQLRQRRHQLMATHGPAPAAGDESLRQLVELAEQAFERMASMEVAERIEVLALLDVKVTVLDESRSPRLRIEGAVPWGPHTPTTEVVDLLAALNTGHEGGCGTLHANKAVDVPARLEALACAAGLTREAVHSQIAAALDAVVHLVRDPGGGHRRVAEICLLEREPSGLVTAVPAVTFAPDGSATHGPAFAVLAARCPGVLS